MKLIFVLIQTILVELVITKQFTWAEVDNIQHGQQDVFVSTPTHLFNDGSVGDRNKNFIIVFTTAFNVAPQVAVGINQIKCYQNSLFNIDIKVQSVRIDSFTLQVSAKSSQQCDLLSINYIAIPASETRIVIQYFFYQISGQPISDQTGPNRQYNLDVALNTNGINIPILCGFQIAINSSTQVQLSLGFNSDNTKFMASTSDENQIKYISGFQIVIQNKNNADYGLQVYSSITGSSKASTYTTPILSLGDQNILPFFSYNSFSFDRSYPLVLQQGQVQLQNNQYIFTYGPNAPSFMYQYGLVYFNAKYKQCDPLYKYLFDDQFCLTQCPQSYFPNNSLNTCSQCHPSCLTCSNSNTIDNCTTCGNNKILQNNQCICQNGYFLNPSDLTYTCNKCSYLCKECSGNQNNCTKCNLSRSLDGTVCKCQDGYWDSISSAFCPKCYRNCKTCYGGLSNNCLSCNSGYYLYSDGTCTCDYGYYDDPLLNSCLKCHSTCGQCNGPLNINCISCTSNRTLQFNKCVCADGLVESILKGVPTCIVNQTTQCLPNCIKCSYVQIGNQDSINYQIVPQCLQCQNNMILKDGSCICGDGTYLVDDQICFPCEKTCKTCYKEGVHGCSSCFSNYQIQNDHSCRNIFRESSESNNEHLEAYITLLAILLTVLVIGSFVYFHRKFEQRKKKYKQQLEQVNKDKITIKQQQKKRKHLNLYGSDFNQEQKQTNIHDYVFEELDEEYNPSRDQLEQPSQQLFDNTDQQQQQPELNEIKQDSEEIEQSQIEGGIQNESHKEKVKNGDEVELVIDINEEN